MFTLGAQSNLFVHSFMAEIITENNILIIMTNLQTTYCMHQFTFEDE